MSILLSDIADFILSLTWERPVLWIATFGLIFSNWKRFFEALVLMAFSVVFSFWLKFVFSSLTDLRTFPSTQTLLAMCFFGYLAIYFKHNIAAIAVCIFTILAVSSSLLILGYHNILDILGSFFFGSLLIGLLLYTDSKIGSKSIY